MAPHSSLTVAWIPDFGLEWLPDLPDAVRGLPRQHPLSWQRVLLSELEKEPRVRLHIVLLRSTVGRSISFERHGVMFHVVKFPAGWRSRSLYWLDTILIGRVLKRIKPDLVHAWGTEKGAGLVAHRLPYPHLLTVQGLVAWYLELVPMGLYWRFARQVEKYSLPRAPLVTTESSVAVQYLQRQFPALPVWQVEHAPDWIFHRLERRPQTKPFRFLFVGTLCRRKGADLLILALDRLKDEMDFELRLIGQAEAGLLEELQAITSKEIWKRVRSLGNLLPSEVAEELANVAILLFPTRADTSPNAVKEAVVAGVPVVASNVGGILDYVLPGQNGLLFPSDDLAAFVAAIREACHHPSFSRGLVDPGALAKARTYLSPANMSARFVSAYEVLHATFGKSKIESSVLPSMPSLSPP